MLLVLGSLQEYNAIGQVQPVPGEAQSLALAPAGELGQRHHQSDVIRELGDHSLELLGFE